MAKLMLRSLIDPGVRSKALDLHSVILTAVEAGKPGAAREAMAHHVDAALITVMKTGILGLKRGLQRTGATPCSDFHVGKRLDASGGWLRCFA